MNKKFSTLAAAFLLAGSFSSAFAQSQMAGEGFKKGTVVYLTTSAPVSTFMGVKDGAYAEDITTLNENIQFLVEEIDVNGKKYALKNVANGKYLTYNNAWGFDQKDATTKYFVYESSNSLMKLADGTTNAFYVVEIDPITSTSTALNNNQGWKKGFALEFKSADHKKVVAVEENVFTAGKIVAIDAEAALTSNIDENNPVYNNALKGLLLKVAGDWNGSDKIYEYKYDTATGTGAWKVNEANLAKFRASKFIVMDKEAYSNFQTNVDGGEVKGYKFITVSGAQLLNKNGKDIAATGATSVTHPILNAIFTVKQDPTTPLCANDLIISLANPQIWDKTLNDDKGGYKAANTGAKAWVSIFEFEGKYYVASGKEEKEAIDSHLTLKDNMLAKHKDLLGKIVNIVSDKNTSWTAESEEVAVSYIDGTVPEGQWIVTGYDKKEGDFSFINRESDEDFVVKANHQNYTLYKTATANKYEAVYNDGASKRDLTITEAPARASIFEDYANLDESKLIDQTYNISVVTSLYENVYLAETGLAKTVELTADKAEAGAWKLVKYYSDKNYEAGIEVADTVYHIHANINFWNPNKQGGAGWDVYKDTLAMFAYTIQNEAGKYLAYNDIKKSYEVKSADELKAELKVDEFTAREHAPKFIFKEKHGQNNIVALENVDFKSSADKSWKIKNDATTNYADKQFGAFSYNKVDKEENIYNVIDNDLFAIEEVSAPEYRRIAGMDTIKIFKDDNHSDILFEKGSFLGMEHLSDFADMKPAMFADTAYVRYETRKPQYLLVVNPNQVIDKEECEIPNHPHAQADTLYGRFLVNMVDSAKAYAATENKLENPYMWEGGYKLAFRAGKHTGDKLIMDVATPTAKDTIDLSQNVNKIGTYAFRYVDRESESFIIETSLDGSTTAGYIKWLNGTPVVIAEREKAEVFNLSETEEAPTANEEVEVSEVSVVAANGSVIVKGAANKNVAISNILGQTIANTVISSDNATIAVPAGIVVVAVEGEDAVKVVVK